MSPTVGWVPLEVVLGRARMLLVEDDAVLARSLARVLSVEVDVMYASTLREALDALAGEDRFDAVWSDRHLQGPDDGVEVLIEASRAHPQALLLLVSGTLEVRGLERLPTDVVVVHKSRTGAATEIVLARLGAAS